MNHYEQLIADFLNEYKEVSLEKIGVIKTTGGNAHDENGLLPVNFIFDRKAATSPELIEYIAQKTSKSKMLIASDLESHFAQAREFINIGKTYEIINAGFIKKNNSGVYEFIPASQAVKAQKNFSKPVHKKAPRKKAAGTAVQLFTLLIVLAILTGLGWEAYQFFVKPRVNTIIETDINNDDSSDTDTGKAIKNDVATAAVISPGDTTASVNTTHLYNTEDTVDIKYIFETTNLLLRAQSRTEKLIGFGNSAGYDSTANGRGKIYSLYIFKRTKIADTLRIKDSIGKFLQKPIEIKVVSK